MSMIAALAWPSRCCSNACLFFAATALRRVKCSPLTDHTDAVNSVAFSPDGKRIESGSYDGTRRLWDAATGQPIGASLTGHAGGVANVSFSSDGLRIVSGSDDSTLRLWTAPAQAAWPAILCAKLTSNMSYKHSREWVSPAIEYIKACPDLPIGRDQLPCRNPVVCRARSAFVPWSAVTGNAGSY
jgi:WD40 repeat protein